MIARAVASVRAQRPFLPAEIIVVDDGSTDQSADVASALHVRVIRQDNAGEGEARNTGLLNARYEWVALLDSDDEWLPEHIAALWPHRHGRVLVSSVAMGSSSGRTYGNRTRRVLPLDEPGRLFWPENPEDP